MGAQAVAIGRQLDGIGAELDGIRNDNVDIRKDGMTITQRQYEREVRNMTTAMRRLKAF